VFAVKHIQTKLRQFLIWRRCFCAVTVNIPAST